MNQNIPSHPYLEHELLRDPRLGFEPAGGSFVRCLEHGIPWPLERWHYHDEYELQLIPETYGRAFVGDYIGHYSPGYLALVGPRLPHNWIASELPPEGVPLRHLVIQFLDTPLRKGMEALPELADLCPLLERARRGIEFFGMTDDVEHRFYRIKESKGLARFIEFTSLLQALANCNDYKLLSSAQMQSNEDGSSMTRINKVLDHIHQNYAEELSIDEVASISGMAESSFSRYFRRATGNTYTDFIARLRVTKACQLLEQTDKLISDVGLEVGFNNLAYFNRKFLELKNVTPSGYRRQVMSKYRQSTSRATAKN
jgi:AraC-like DNA-binding protein